MIATNPNLQITCTPWWSNLWREPVVCPWPPDRSQDTLQEWVQDGNEVIIVVLKAPLELAASHTEGHHLHSQIRNWTSSGIWCCTSWAAIFCKSWPLRLMLQALPSSLWSHGLPHSPKQNMHFRPPCWWRKCHDSSPPSPMIPIDCEHHVFTFTSKNCQRRHCESGSQIQFPVCGLFFFFFPLTTHNGFSFQLFQFFHFHLLPQSFFSLWMRINLGIFCIFKSPSTSEN